MSHQDDNFQLDHVILSPHVLFEVNFMELQQGQNPNNPKFIPSCLEKRMVTVEHKCSEALSMCFTSFIDYEFSVVKVEVLDMWLL